MREMPNGTRGDHPITDIVVHHLRVFTAEIDGLIAEVDELGGWQSDFAAMALAQWHHDWQRLPPDSEAATVSLSNLRLALMDERDRLLGFDR